MNSDPMSDSNDAPPTPASEGLVEGVLDVLDKKSSSREQMPTGHQLGSPADAVEDGDGTEGELDGDSDGDDDDDLASSRGGAPAEPVVAVEQVQFADVVSGRFDADEVDEQLLPPKRVLAPQPEFPKLHKILAQAGLGSRLEMEQLITEGRISVNNEPAHIGQRIQFGDSVKVNGKPVRVRIQPPPPRVIAYHKEVGEIVTHGDPQNRPTVYRKLPKLGQGKWQSVGRLDINTEGLLLFTNSGELANRLMHPRFGLEREYAVRSLGSLSLEERQRLLDGVNLDDGLAKFDAIEDGGGEGANCWYRVRIREGRNREVRRMFESVGHAVSRLIRIRYGSMALPRGLRRGHWMELTDREVETLAGLSGHRAGPAPRDAGRGRMSPDRGAGGQRRRGGKPSVPRQRDPMVTRFGGNHQGEARFDKSRGAGRGSTGAGGQPDPMRTSLGYINNDRFPSSTRSGGARGDGPRSAGNNPSRGSRSGRRRGPSGA